MWMTKKIRYIRRLKIKQGVTEDSVICQHLEKVKSNKTLLDYALAEDTTEYHLPGHNYAGPGTHTITRMLKGDLPTTYIDKAALVHDIEYMKPNNKMKADLNMYKNLMKQAPYLFSLNTIVYKGLLLSTPFYQPVGDNDMYYKAKEYAIKHYDVKDMFAD